MAPVGEHVVVQDAGACGCGVVVVVITCATLNTNTGTTRSIPSAGLEIARSRPGIATSSVSIPSAERTFRIADFLGAARRGCAGAGG